MIELQQPEKYAPTSQTVSNFCCANFLPKSVNGSFLLQLFFPWTSWLIIRLTSSQERRWVMFLRPFFKYHDKSFWPIATNFGCTKMEWKTVFQIITHLATVLNNFDRFQITYKCEIISAVERASNLKVLFHLPLWNPQFSG